MFNRFAIAAAIAFALAACGGGGSGGGPKPSPGDDNTGNTPPPVRPSPHGITTVGGNELKVGDASSNWYVMNGEFVRKPRTPGIRWVTATEYPAMEHLPRIYVPGTPQIVQGDDWTAASSFYWGNWSDNDKRLYFGGYQYEPDTTKRIARFGVSLENNEITPWAAGVKPLTNFSDIPSAQSLGTAYYDGIFIGLTHSEKQPIGGAVAMEFDLSRAGVTGTFWLGELVTVERDGSLEPFLEGSLQHDIAVTGNTFTTTGGDPGTVTGIFAGEDHEVATGTFQHSAFTGTFGAELGDYQGPTPPGGSGTVPVPGGSGTSGPTPPGSNAAYTVSADGGTFGSLPVTVSADAITVANRTVTLDAASQAGGRSGHYRAFDSAGATSGPATEVHYFGKNDGYSHLQFGSWARGVVSPNPGFRIGEQFGAFLTPYAGVEPTPTSSLPTTGTATWSGHYAGYVDRQGVGVSQVVGRADIVAVFGQTRFGDGGILVELLPPDPNRSSFAVPSTSRYLGYQDRVLMNGVIAGNTFENDLAATYTVVGQTLPRGDTISVYSSGSQCRSAGDCLYSPGLANSGGMQGGFFGSRGGAAGGTYRFTIGTTKAAGSFGGRLQ